MGVIVAAGSGTRLGQSAAGGAGPKALRRLAGRPLVTWSATQLLAGGVQSLVVVCPPDQQDEFSQALAGVGVQVVLTPGGASRQESVRAGLALIPDDAQVVLVHDAARPMVPQSVVSAVIAAVRGGAKAVVPVIPVVDTIRRLDDDAGSQVVDRAMLRAVQTPQGFDRDTLLAAHQNLAGAQASDDAGLCQACGHEVVLVEGSTLAMKITRPVDFAVAEALAAELADRR